MLWKSDNNTAEGRERLIWNFGINSGILTLLVKTNASTFS